jgi:hypothetical protein
MNTINIPEVISNLVKSSENELKLIISGDIPLVVDAATKYLANLENRASALLNVVADKDFKGDKLAFVLARIKDEKTILETEVFSFIIIGQGVAQNIINSIQGIIIDAIQAILPQTQTT